jgi:hydroxypyruvate isomerase
MSTHSMHGRQTDAHTTNEAANDGRVTRRGWLSGLGAVAAGLAAVGTGVRPARAAEAGTTAAMNDDAPGTDYRIQRGRIRQSVMGWCYDVPTEKLIDACHRMGMPAMEGISREHYPRLRELGMHPAIVGSHTCRKGPPAEANREHGTEKLREPNDDAAEFGSPNVITFTGMNVDGLSRRRMEDNCVACWKRVIEHAEEKGVNLCLEHLNTRDDTHPMKGHPGYFGDDVDRCVELIERVGSPRMRLLFDIYHVQIMNGDVIRRIREHKDHIGHVHTAGNPGRGELDGSQEINYPAVMRTLLEVGYDGFVAQEFIPTWDDQLAALRHGVRVCDV